MPNAQQKPPDPQSSYTGHPLPRRATASNSVTLRHHKLARDASLRATATSAQSKQNDASRSNTTSSPRRNSSGESHDTGNSDPKKWFDQSNQNPTATFDNSTMDVDPPFYQKESDSSNESKEYPYMQSAVPPGLLTGQSSSAGDYRSVIDDLTVEIQKLKDELKRYKQQGPDMLRKEKLFEIKIHGLPKRKKRELESTLRDFAASLSGSPNTSSSQRKNMHANRDHMYSGSGASKHASSSSGSNTRPVDSAYASMSTGAHSSGASLARASAGGSRTKSSEQKVESYLRDIPEGLHPRHVVMTEKDKKKLVVRRLEHLFTGKMGGRPAIKSAEPNINSANLAPVLTEQLPYGNAKAAAQTRPLMHRPPTLLTAPATAEFSREARMLPHNGQTGSHAHKASRSRDNGSANNSNDDHVEFANNDNGMGDATPLVQASPPEQRATQPRDLDPDRIQIPSENMDYIKHLGLVPPELLADDKNNSESVRPDAEGWVYLNLLCSLAQLHIINVTPSFVRAAVAEMSTKFQLSSDGRKIRWRGGMEGTRFAGDSSTDLSENSPHTDETDGSSKEESRKRQKTGQSTGDEMLSGGSSKNTSKIGPQVTASTESFQYKPLFVHQVSPNGQTSMDETVSSFGPVEESNIGDSGWGSGTSLRKKRRHDGAIIYYSGAPFCTDLSGDTGESSPTAYMLSSGLAQQDDGEFARPLPRRSPSGSCLPYRPLSDKTYDMSSKIDVDMSDVPALTSDDDDDVDDVDFDLNWSKDQQYINVHPLEPCGLGGVLPDDHFMVVVTTRRPTRDLTAGRNPSSKTFEEMTDGIIGRLATMTTSSPLPQITDGSTRSSSPGVEIEYISGRIKRLAPVALPPPAIFVPPFSTDGSTGDEDEMTSSEEDTSSESLISRRADLHQSDGYPDGVDLSSGDEDGEDPDDEFIQDEMTGQAMDQDNHSIGKSSAEAAAGTTRGRSKSTSADLMLRSGA